MSQQAVMILLDNSDWARNGDYQQNRWEAQYEVASQVTNQVCTARQENAVGLITMAGRQVQVHLTPINDQQKFLACLHHVKLEGSIHFSTSIQIANLALRHRVNKSQTAKIFVIVASPVIETEEQLIQLGKKLKKTNVQVDLINIGEISEAQQSKLDKFIKTVCSDNNSHFISIQPNIASLTDALVGTAFLGGQNQEYNNNDNFNINNQMDPELAQAIQISLEEDKQREEKKQQQVSDQSQQQGKQEGGQQQQGQQQSQEKAAAEQKNAKEKEPEVKNEIKEEQKLQTPQKNVQANKMEEEEINEEELLKRAKEISLMPDQTQDKQQQQETQMAKEVIQDPQFLNDLLNMVPELNKQDPNIQLLLQGQKQDQKKDEEKKNDAQKQQQPENKGEQNKK